MIYKTTKCPYCGYILDSMNPSPDKFAPEFLPCPNCHNTYKTGKKLWSDMSDDERSEYCLNEYLKAIISSFFVGFIFDALFVGYVLKYKINFLNYLIVTAIVIVVEILLTKAEIKKSKDITYDSYMQNYNEKYKK